VTEAHVCEQLAQGRYLTAKRPGVELATSPVASQRPNHYTTMPDSAARSNRKLKFVICYVLRQNKKKAVGNLAYNAFIASTMTVRQAKNQTAKYCKYY